VSSSDSKKISHVDFDLSTVNRLSANEVHLWRIHLDNIAPAESRWRSILSSDELARATRFHFVRDRQSFTATRALLRIILGTYVGCGPAGITFVYTERGRPLISPQHGDTGLQFTVSHSGTRALLAFAKSRQVGVDVEQIRTNFDFEAIAQRYFSPAEQKALATMQTSELFTGFFRCWTRKEAYIKAHGLGLSFPLRDFDVSIKRGEKNALVATRPNADEAALWSLCDLDVGDGYAAALSVKGHDWVLRD
jgi:4'-phosphopantetheinyl transferase